MQHANMQSSRSGRTRRILLVEDHDGYRSVVCDALGWYLPGVAVLTAGSVGEALEVLRSEEVDVMVADMTLPDGSAVDLVTGAGDMIGRNGKVIFFSSYSSAEMLPVLSRPDVHGFVSKEQGVKALVTAIRKTMSEAGEVIESQTQSPV